MPIRRDYKLPIPVPQGEDEKRLDLGPCIRFLRRENPEMDNEQRIAVCMSTWRKAQGKSEES